MVFRVELRFVDESEFQKQGKWYILPQNPECEIDSTILFESDGSLDEEEYDSEEEFDEDSADSLVLTSSNESDSDYSDEASTFAGSKIGEKATTKKRRKPNSSGKQGKDTRPTAGKNADSSTSSTSRNSKSTNKDKKGKATNRGGKKNAKVLTSKELDDLKIKLEEKRPMCWSFVSERLSAQYVAKHYASHRNLIEEILDVRYNELRDLVHHMFSSYIKLLSGVAEDVKKDRKVHLAIRWVNSLNSYLDGLSENAMVCRPVYTELSKEYSSVTIRAVTGILHSLVYDFAQTESYSASQPLDVQHNITPEDDVSLYRISGAALCQMIQLRKDTLSEKKGKRKITPQSRSEMEIELHLLMQLKETDKSHLPNALKVLDEGNLTFVKKDFLNFVREADVNIREFVNEKRLKKHKNSLLKVVHFNVYNDDQLLKSFKWSIEKCGSSHQYHSSVIDKVFSDILHKLCNTRTKEFFRGKFEKDLATSGKVVDADQSLRDNLKTFSIAKKR